MCLYYTRDEAEIYLVNEVATIQQSVTNLQKMLLEVSVGNMRIIEFTLLCYLFRFIY